MDKRRIRREKRAQSWMHTCRVEECRKHTNWKALGPCTVERQHAQSRDDQDYKGQGQEQAEHEQCRSEQH
eukprot:12739758-Heterocapsa_arctica.AAC.1